MTVLLLLAVAAFAAGWIDAVVGGGGLIQLPALMVAFPQAAPVHLLATNKLGSICGTSTSAITFARRVRPDRHTAISLAVAAFLGATIGAAIASALPRAVFDPIILVVLIGVGAWTLLKPEMGQQTALRWQGRRHLASAGAVGFVIGVYDGAIGPGTGSFLVIALVGLVGYAFLEASAKAKIANFATNLAALVVFIPQGAPWWGLGLVMGACNMAGGYLGARTAVARGAGFVRIVFICVVAAFTVKIGWDTLNQFTS